MSDRLDARIRAFVVEMLDDPPEAPPFPHPDMVVVNGDRSQRRGTVTETKTEDRATRSRQSRGLLVAVGAFVVVAVIGIAALLAATVFDDPQSEVAGEDGTSLEGTVSEESTVNPEEGAAALVGTTGTVVGGDAGTLPDSIEFAADGTFRVFDRGIAVDTGTYTTAGESINFESAPTEEVMWVNNDAFLRVAHTCEGFIGEYHVAFSGGNLVTLEAMWDECPNRVTVANGLELELATG